MRTAGNFQRLPRRNRTFSKARAGQREAAIDALVAGREAGCYKRAFPDKAAAEAARRRINASPGPRPKILRSVYRCRRCRCWHLTSQEQH